MIEARVANGRHQPRDVKGRTIESIARTHFGRNAEVRKQHNPAFIPEYEQYDVLLRDKKNPGVYHVLGGIYRMLH